MLSFITSFQLYSWGSCELKMDNVVYLSIYWDVHIYIYLLNVCVRLMPRMESSRSLPSNSCNCLCILFLQLARFHWRKWVLIELMIIFGSFLDRKCHFYFDVGWNAVQAHSWESSIKRLLLDLVSAHLH